MFPTKKGQTFRFQNENYTVRAFFGSSGLEFDSHDQAKQNNPKDTFICISSEEYLKGAMKDTECTLI